MQVTVEVPEQFARYVEIVIKPFVKVDDVTKLLECSTSCAYKELTKLKLKKYPWGVEHTRSMQKNRNEKLL